MSKHVIISPETEEKLNELTGALTTAKKRATKTGVVTELIETKHKQIIKKNK